MLRTVYGVVGFVAIDDVVADGDTLALHVRSEVAGQPLDEMMLLRLDGAGLVRELTLFVRPMPGLVTFAAVLGPVLAPTRPRRLALKAMFAPLAALVRTGEPIGVRLTGVGTPSAGR